MTREILATRRRNRSVSFECENHKYTATGGWFPDGRLAEVFLVCPGKLGTPLQANADNVAILTSLLLQHGVSPQVVQHSVTGPIRIALELFAEERA